MEAPFKAQLTPEQLDAINASGGFAQCEDPTNHVLYHLIRFERSDIDDDYVRKRIEESYADAAITGVEPLDMAAIKLELQRRVSTKHSP